MAQVRKTQLARSSHSHQSVVETQDEVSIGPSGLQASITRRPILHISERPHILHNKPEVERFSMHTHPPRTLKEWREQKGSFPRNFWNPLESFFLSRGYTLWGPRSTWWLIPPNDAPRTPDGFAYRTVYNEIKPDKYFFNMIVSPVALYYFQVSPLIEEFYSLPCTHDRGPRCLDPPNGHWCRPRRKTFRGFASFGDR